MATLLFLSLLCTCPADVLQVDAAAGPYFQIRDAVEVAQDDDVILVAPGTYDHFGIMGKGIAILPRTAGAVRVRGTVRVQNVPPGRTVVLKGLKFDGPTFMDPALRCASNQGSVRVEDCRVESTAPFDTGYGALVTDCADITFLDFVSESGFTALRADDSNVSLFGGTFAGWSIAAYGLPSPGYPGIEFYRCSVFASGVRAVGGAGRLEDSTPFHCVIPPGQGGDAVVAVDTQLALQDVVLVPGIAGGSTWFNCPSAGPGRTLAVYGATTVTQHNGPRLGLLSPATGHTVEGTVVSFTLLGEVGAPSVLVVGSSADRMPLPGITGDLLVNGAQGTVRRIPFGPAPAVRDLAMPLLSSSFGIMPLYLQAMQIQSSGIVLGPSRILAVLGSGW